MFVTLKKIFGKMGVIDKWLSLFVVLGCLIIVISLFRGIWASSELKVLQINTTDSDIEPKKIFVDIEGAVVNPGVYEMKLGDRIKDILVKSGGFSADADRNYVAKVVNLAEQLKDGQKVYIPFVSGTPEVMGYSEAKSRQKMVNVNTSSVQELDTLWGIGEARAESIVKSRPYSSLEDMVQKRVITTQILEKNKDIMSVY